MSPQPRLVRLWRKLGHPPGMPTAKPLADGYPDSLHFQVLDYFNTLFYPFQEGEKDGIIILSSPEPIFGKINIIFMINLQKIFKEGIEKKASDIHLVGGELPMLRINGGLVEISEEKLNNDELEEVVAVILTNEQKRRFLEESDLDVGYEIEGVRFRINLHRQDRKIGLSARIIPSDVPSPQDLNFEEAILKFANLNDGLVLVTGPTGCGKSTTIASLIEEINKTRKAHIVTIEDPIEFVFKDKKSLIEQREVGVDTKSFASALKYVLRQDPDIIFVGEMRDPETISTVLTAAETGHLVFSTLHTSSAAEAVERIVDVFEGSKQKQILIQLSSVLRGVVAQHLLPKKGGGRVAVREILVNNPAVSNLIRENNISQIKSAMQTGAKDGMVTLEKVLEGYVGKGLVEKEVAVQYIGQNKKA